MEDTIPPPAILGFTSEVFLRTNRPGALRGTVSVLRSCVYLNSGPWDLFTISHSLNPSSLMVWAMSPPPRKVLRDAAAALQSPGLHPVS